MEKHRPLHGVEHGHMHHDSHSHAVQTSGERAEIDPVCGMKVSADAKFSVEHEGKTYRFCSEKCESTFVAQPQRYLSPIESAPVETQEGTVYTCPMHPQIRHGPSRQLPHLRDDA